ncbi:MAG: hypothetical protein HY321_08795 [Armatimonadetes bacterium]|nr:hypothetical protein [Armatimonadota bacterium]
MADDSGRKRSIFVHPDVAHQGRDPLSAGYYSWEGTPAVRRAHASWPLFLCRGEWKHVPDLGKFDHEASRIDEKTFLRMLRGHLPLGDAREQEAALARLLQNLEHLEV